MEPRSWWLHYELRPTLVAACEVLMEVPPLDLWIRGAAFKNLCCMNENYRISRKTWSGSGSGQEIVCSLEPFATVFQAEVRAIADCAKASLLEGIRNRSIVICLNSRVALMVLDGFLIRFKEVLKCRKLFEEVTIDNSLILLWVLGQSNILGNE